MSKKHSTFLRNCDHPVLTPMDGVIKGKIPPWLNGSLIRNGPGIHKIGNDRYTHMFDGLAVLHRFDIQHGKVTYSSRPLESTIYNQNTAANRIAIGAFGAVAISDPCETLFSRFKSMFISGENDLEPDTADNCSINVGYYGDQLYAMTETSVVRRIDPTSLKCIGDGTKLQEYVVINQATAHPHVLTDGTVLNLGVKHNKQGKGSTYLVIQVPPSFGASEPCFKDMKIIAEIPSRWTLYPCYFHSFGMTKDKIIFIEQPFCISVLRFLMRKFITTTLMDILTWYPSEKTRIYVVSIFTGEIHPVIYETDNLFTFHHTNAYEEDGQIIMDLSGYDSGEVVSKYSANSAENIDDGSSARRYVLPLNVPRDTDKDKNLVELPNTTATATFRGTNKTSTIVDIKPEILQDEWHEFPRINYKYNGLKYRYIYACNKSSKIASGFPEPDTLVKLDLQNRNEASWVQKGTLVSEPVFVPNPTIENPEEDDGVILANLLHADNVNKTTFIVLDAKTMAELAAVEFNTNGPIPVTLHGQWAQIGNQIHSL